MVCSTTNVYNAPVHYLSLFYSSVLFITDISFSFTENSYTMTESAGNIPVMVLKDQNKRLANPVMIRITPMIVKVALQRGIIKEFPNNTVSPIRARKELVYSRCKFHRKKWCRHL